jgi:hypothetical protein
MEQEVSPAKELKKLPANLCQNRVYCLHPWTEEHSS